MKQRRCEKEFVGFAHCNLQLAPHVYLHALGQCFGRLGADEQRILRLRCLQALTIEEVAEELNIPWEEADRLIDQAVAKVRWFLSDWLKANRKEDLPNEASRFENLAAN